MLGDRKNLPARSTINTLDEPCHTFSALGAFSDRASAQFFRFPEAGVSHWKNEEKKASSGACGGGENRPHALYDSLKKLTGFPLG
jgi:hypothetical protein